MTLSELGKIHTEPYRTINRLALIFNSGVMKLKEGTGITGDLGGTVSVKLKPGHTFNEFCEKHIPGFNPQRLEAFAVRIYYANEITVTVYAVDHAEPKSEGHLPVKKFKLNIGSLQGLFAYVDSFNSTITTGNYDLEDMEVENK